MYTKVGIVPPFPCLLRRLLDNESTMRTSIWLNVVGMGSVFMLLLSGCSGDSSKTKGQRVSPDCSGDPCAAEAGAFNAGDVGVWKYENTSDKPVYVNLSLSNAEGRRLLLVFTNTSDVEQAMTAITLSEEQAQPAVHANSYAHIQRRHPHSDAGAKYRQRLSLEYKNKKSSRLEFLMPYSAPRSYVVGDQRNWNISASEDTIVAPATLKRQVTAFDGRKINFWVEDKEFATGLIDDSILDYMTENFVTGPMAAYTSVVALAGQPWGAHAEPQYIDPHQDLDIVIANFDNDGAILSSGAYFWSLHNYLASEFPDSNEALSFYVDSETIYLNRSDDGSLHPHYLGGAVTTLVHEMTHMNNFYQREVLHQQGYDEAWMEELTASMMEDFHFSSAPGSLSSTIYDRYLSFVALGSPNCDFTAYTGDYTDLCYSYDVLGTLGAYLLRHYKVPMMTHLLQNFSADNALDLLRDSVLVKSGLPLEAVLPRVASTAWALMPSESSPAHYGFPRYDEGDFYVHEFKGNEYAEILSLPTTVPEKILPYGSFTVLRSQLKSTYHEVVRVPPKTTLTVVGQKN